MKIKKIIAFVLCLQVIFACLFETALAYNNESDSNFTNLIIFAKFGDEDEFINDNYGESVRKITDNSYNSAQYNVSDYFRSVSNGKVNMNSVYLFDNGGSVTLSRKRAYYASGSDENPDGYFDSGERAKRMYQLKEDWAQAVNRAIGNGITDYSGKKKYDLSELDKNHDGYIDLITIIYKPTTQTNISVEWASPLWNYRDQTSLVEADLNGMSLHSRSYVQMTKDYKYLYTDANGNKITAIGVNSHETAHGFGLLDLYQSSYQPVGYMSAMGKHTTEVAQFISVKERESLGWLGSKNINYILNEGNYTLNVIRDEKTDGVVGYKMDIPEIGKTLYLEYRRFDGKGSKYDSQKKDLYLADGSKIRGLSLKSGLVCYLLTTGIKFPSNLQSSVNNWNYSVLGGRYNNKPDAALAAGEYIEITDDLFIEVTKMTDDELTFSIEGTFFDSTDLPSVNGIEITKFSDEIALGESCSFAAHVFGTNNPPQSVIWSVENNTDAETNISENGVLRVGKNESATELKISASYENKFFDSREIKIIRTAHNFEYHKATAATCESDGNFEYYFCRDCGKYFVDMGESFEETTLENMTIKAPGHIAGEWKIVKIATETEKGIMQRKCVGCGLIMETKEYDLNSTTSNAGSIFAKLRTALKRIFDLIRKIILR